MSWHYSQMYHEYIYRDPMHFEGGIVNRGWDRVEVYASRRGVARRKQWRWRYIAGNGKRTANSGEGYANLGDLFDSLANVLGVPRASLNITTPHANARLVDRLGDSGRKIHLVVLR
jgi:hypothetical protein